MFRRRQLRFHLVALIRLTVALALGPASAQQNREAVEEHLKQAQLHLQNENYAAVVEHLEKAQALHAAIPGSYYQLGLAYFELGQFERAKEAFQHELTFEPPDSYSLYYLGRIHADQGLNAEAARFYEAAREHAEVLDVTRQLGAVYLRLSQAEEAVQLLEPAVRSQPENGDLRFVLARAYLQLGREADARREFDQSESWKRKTQEDIRGIMEVRRLLAEQQFGQALDVARRVGGTNDPDISLALGIALAEHGMNGVAERTLRNSAEQMPHSPEAHFNLGRVLASQSDWAASLEPLEKAVALRPEFYEAQVMLGTAYANLSRTDEAIARLQAAADLRPKNGSLHGMLGLQYLEGSYYQQAVSAFRKAVELSPTEPNLRFLLVQAHFRNHDYEDALAVAREAAERFPDLARSHIELAIQLDNLGRYEEAQTCLEAALERDPTMLTARVMLGEALFKQGRAQESVAEFQKALSADDKSTAAYAGLGKALIQLKRYDEAVTSMRQAIEADSRAPALHLYLSQAYRALGKVDEAKKEAAIFTRLNREAAKMRDQDVERIYEPK